MKKLLLLPLVLSMLVALDSLGQDVRVNAITNPSSGCNLGPSEIITLEIENVGTIDLSGTPFTVTYVINAGAPVTEPVVIASFLPNTTTTYSFLTVANFSIPGGYVIDGSCLLIGDVNPSNDAINGYLVTSDAPTVGGSVAGSATVCSSGNAGVLTLSGHTGSVNRWEYSIDGGISWILLANTTTSQNYLNLTTTSTYRSVVQNGTCPEVISASATITVNQAPVGGSVTASTEVCETYNTGTLALTGESGTIVDWEFSVNSGATWTSVGNTTNTLVFNNLTTTTWYRVIVDNGVCGTVISSIGVVTVHPKPIPLYTVADVCIGATSSFVNGTSIAAGVTSFYLWDFGDGTSSVSLNPVHTYGAPGIYSASLITISDEGCADTAFVNAIVNALPDPTITANGPVAFCMGGSVDLSGEPGLNYLWSTTEITQTITINTSGLYTLNVVDPITLCANMDTMTVTVWVNPVANAGNDTTISLGWVADLHGSGGNFYQWSPAATLDDAFIATPIAYPLISTGYELTVTDLNGCMDIDSVIVTVLVDYLFTPANVVTPNGDGENDVWNIINIENYPDNQVAIYNRYGQEIFKASGYNNEWDATFEGKQVPDASYYYVLTFDGSEKIFKGAITVLGK